MTAKDPRSDKVLHQEKREFFEIGLDIEGRMRYGAWQIKEILDLTLPPIKTREERFLFTLPKDTKEAIIEVKTYYCIKGSKCDLIYSEKKEVTYPEL
ncbi:hypothetical protein TDIS_0312 [Thermosulfurimonas dismutans]|uniref:Uncharacterized protein n=1 Tax=Thermosulfurimonas dismutans TaxID=999894 RepID=A0A179D6S2_9BACT|nr:hypothetical protein TDIS_0312 [Thermosulfurimonas dismutans]